MKYNYYNILYGIINSASKSSKKKFEKNKTRSEVKKN